MNVSNASSSGFLYKHRTVSTAHLEELQRDIDKLKNEGKLSDNSIYRGYLGNKRFRTPEKLPDARSLIILAIPTKPMLVTFHLDGRTYEFTLPPQYYDDGITDEALEKTVLQQIVRKPDCRVERAKGIHLKLLAVRSGLGKYGRNNLCYVEGMGSLLTLVAYFTDCQLEDNWNPIEMMDACSNCKACTVNCPNQCITDENFVIDAGRCLSLYNEIEGIFPEWISRNAHNALMGCMRCQSICPGNSKVISLTGRLGDVTEEETRMILNGTPSQELLDSLSRKLRDFSPTQSAEAFHIFTRNLKALLNTESNTPK